MYDLVVDASHYNGKHFKQLYLFSICDSITVLLIFNLDRFCFELAKSLKLIN